MESICVNTTTLSNVVNDLNNTRKYYNNKKNTFYVGAFSSTSKLSNYINKVRSNYVDIHNNIMNVALLLEDYYKDIEGIENKFSNNTGYIDDSNTSSIASKYANSLIDYTVSGDDLFQVNQVETVINNVVSVADVIVGGVGTIFGTGAVITTSVVSGVGDVVEGVVDGVAWVAKGAVSLVEFEVNSYLTIAEAGCRGASFVASLLGMNEASSTLSSLGDGVSQVENVVSQASDYIRTGIKSFIKEDHVEGINQAFYENTFLGSAINDASLLKYDSEIAGTIENVSEDITKFVAATGATIFTGGAAAFALGALYGTGTQAESTYQENGTDSTLLQEVMIGGSGALTGLAWMANGKLGAGFVDIAQSAATIGGSYSSLVGWKQIAKQVVSEVTSKEFLVDTLKEGLASKSAIGNYVSSAMMMADDIIPYITGEETLEVSDIPGLLGKYLLNLGLNVAEDGLRSYVGGFTLNSENQQLIYQRYLNGEITLEELQQKGLGIAALNDVDITVKDIDPTVKDIDPTVKDIDATGTLKDGVIDEYFELRNKTSQILIQQGITDLTYQELVEATDVSGKSLTAEQIAEVIKAKRAGGSGYTVSDAIYDLKYCDSDECFLLSQNLGYNLEDIRYLENSTGSSSFDVYMIVNKLGANKEYYSVDDLGKILSEIDSSFISFSDLNATVLNLGLCTTTEYDLLRASKNEYLTLGYLKKIIKECDESGATVSDLYTYLENNNVKNNDLYVGLMVKASADGVDVQAVVKKAELFEDIIKYNRTNLDSSYSSVLASVISDDITEINNLSDLEQYINNLYKYGADENIIRTALSRTELSHLNNLLSEYSSTNAILSSGEVTSMLQKVDNALEFTESGTFKSKVTKFLEKFDVDIDESKLNDTVDGIKYYTNDGYIYAGGTTTSMGFNNYSGSVINTSYDDLKVINTVTHESTHFLSRITGTDVSGFHTEEKYRGINECVTEYITELIMGDDYYTTVTGEQYSGYQEGIVRLKELMKLGVIDEQDLVTAYFNNDTSYLTNSINNYFNYLDSNLSTDGFSVIDKLNEKNISAESILELFYQSTEGHASSGGVKSGSVKNGANELLDDIISFLDLYEYAIGN